MEIDSFKICNLIFYKSEGEKTHLFGKIIKDKGNAFKEKRLFLLENTEMKNVYSIRDILEFKTEKIDTMTVYVIPD